MTPPSLRQLLPVLIAAVAGLSLGLGYVRSAERTQLESGPSGWQNSAPNIPVLLAELAGPPNAPGDGWPLASHAALMAPGARIQALEAAATLPENGHLELVFEGSGAQVGVALKLDRGRVPYAMVTTAGRPSRDASHPTSDWSPLECDGALPAPTDERVHARMEREPRSVRVTVTVGDAAPTSVTCAWGRPTTGASVRSGLRRIGLRSLAVTAQNQPELRWTAPEPDLACRAAYGLGGLVLLGFLAGALRLRPSGSTVPTASGVPLVLGTLPLWLVWPLSGADLEAGLQAMRLVVDTPLTVAFFGPLAVSAVLLALYGMAWAAARPLALSRPLRLTAGALLGLAAVPAYGAVGLLAAVPGALGAEGLHWLVSKLGAKGWGPAPGMVLGAAFFGGIGALMGPRYGMATTYAAVAGMGVAGLVWANVRKPRGFNVLSIALMGLVVFMSDQGLRWTDTGARLTGRSSRARPDEAEDRTDVLAGTFSSFEALEHTRAWSDYPKQDYPVEPAPRRPDAVRVVALGGSSTGGAWQNDNLDQFWPAELERRHGPSVQAVNQGVGGWTTLHIRRFLETRVADVDPDVVVLYVGHNDIITESVRPYGELFTAWQQGSDLSVSVSGALGTVPLYQLFRFTLQSAVGGGVGPAVPVADARENLRTVASVLTARGVPLLLAREGIAPDPSVLDPYGEMMAALAEQHANVGFVDTSAALTGPGAGDVFLDNCHLTERGHGRVAESVRQALVDAGWIPARR